MNAYIKKQILELAYKSKTGHISSNFSICDILYCLYDGILNVKQFDFQDKKNNERDRFILSKGHAALALYVVLCEKCFIQKDELETYCQNNSIFAVHPKSNINGIEFETGSLGQGITFAVGDALAAKIQKSNRKVYCLISDGEINEGSCWEAFMFANHHKLDNLIILYDNNQLQALGKVESIIKNDNILEKMKAFGFATVTVDGHDYAKMKNTFKALYHKNSPTFINCITIAGKGVSFMENQLKWHYKSMNEEEYKLALKELDIWETDL